VKDRGKEFSAEESDASVDLGTGVIDFKKVAATAKKVGMKYYIVEQERYDNGSSIQAVKDNAVYMRKLNA
jgi:sugar phosphate isomerase/epimerase